MNFLQIMILYFLLHYSDCQIIFRESTPMLTSVVKESSEGFSQFLNLWEHSLRMDNRLPGERGVLGPKTLLLPGDFSMAQLVPQDGSHPLFLNGSEFGKLRLEFILDHLVLEETPADGADQGIDTSTLSGKKVFIKKDPSGNFTVNGVNVKKMVSLKNGYNIYVLEKPLFDQTLKVRQAFDRYHGIIIDDSTGPPLEIPEGPFRPPTTPGSSIVRAPAPPIKKTVGPPAPPSVPRSVDPNS